MSEKTTEQPRGELGKQLDELIAKYQEQINTLTELYVTDGLIVRGVDHKEVKGLVFRPALLTEEQERWLRRWKRENVTGLIRFDNWFNHLCDRSGAPFFYSHAVLHDGTHVTLMPPLLNTSLSLPYPPRKEAE